ncbi:DUF4407 domain-containing protein [Actinomadura luteofluorescens]|uniref:DUF4407 domain-containing protein n=1 Tax=Actinomadura luteofluorescens TaxID=46163 RepID=UPI00346ACD33
MRRFLILLSGARPDILDQAPGERPRWAGIGLVIFLQGVLVALSMGAALVDLLDTDPLPAVPLSLAWGAGTAALTRWTVASLPVGGLNRIWFAVPRVVLAVLIGLIVSTPLVLRVFQSEVEAEIGVIKSERIAEFQAEQEKSPLNERIGELELMVRKYQSETGPLARENLARAQAQLDASRKEQQQRYDAFDQSISAVDGLLIRLEALNRLSRENSTVSTAQLLLALVLVTFACLPLLTRLITRPGAYERLLEIGRQHEIRLAEETLVLESRLISESTSLEEIWDRLEASDVPPQPVSDLRPPALPAPEPARGDDEDAEDRALRRMRDLRPAPTAEEAVADRGRED